MEETFFDPGVTPVFRLFGMPVYPYSLLLVLGLITGLILALRKAKRCRVPADAILTFAMLGLPLGLIMGRLIFCATRLVELMDLGIGYLFRVDYGGFSLMGVTFGIVLAAVLVHRIYDIRFADLLDAVMPGLLIALAFARFAEGSTTNGTGPEIGLTGLCFSPLARQDLYGDYTFAVNMGEALTALIAGIYIMVADKPVSGQSAATGVIITAAAQILWESARRDEVLIISFVRYVMVFSALILLLILILSLRQLDWPWTGKALVILVLFLPAGIAGAMEFAIEGKILAFLPNWLCYLIDALCVTFMGWVTLRTLNAACESK